MIKNAYTPVLLICRLFTYLILCLGFSFASSFGSSYPVGLPSYKAADAPVLLVSENTSYAQPTSGLPETMIKREDLPGIPWMSADCSGELGYEQNYSLREHMSTSSRPFVIFNVSGGLNYGKEDYKLSILGRKETVKTNRRERKDWRFDELWLGKTLESSRIIIGLQKITWGETFGIPIVDIVNHQDNNEHPLNSFEDNKLASWMINYQMVTHSWNLQLIASPWNQQKIAQTEGDSLLIDKSSDHDYRNIFEFGGRIGYLLENGLDIKAFYYHHENHFPVFEPTLNSQFFPVLHQVQKEEDSLGVSQSLAFDASVLRWDLIYMPGFHINSPINGRLFKVPRLGSALGYDYATDFDLLFGLQLQSEILSSSHPDLEEIDQLHYFATQFIYPMSLDRFQIKSVTFFGLGSDEIWQRVELMFYLFNQVRADLIWDDIQGDHIGLLSRNRDLDRLYLKIAWQF